MTKQELEAQRRAMQAALADDVRGKLLTVRGQQVMVDADVASLYGVETRRVNQAVQRNADKFPQSYMFRLDSQDIKSLRSQIVTANFSTKSRTLPAVFTEKGLYMLATILHSKQATAATFAIIETFAAVHSLRSQLVELHSERDPERQQERMSHFGQILSEIVMPDLETSATESTLELNFLIGKLKHTVKRVRRRDEPDTTTDE